LAKWKIQRRVDADFRVQPHDFGAPFNLPNHPVVGIAWYEALAFCRWLTEFGRNKNWLDAKTIIQLPSKAEWEKAARGGEEIPQPQIVTAIDEIRAQARPNAQRKPNDKLQRQYPWGDEPDPNRANYTDTKIGATNAAGCFSNGASPYGCEEMSGNVWEGARSLWGKDWQKPDFVYPYIPADGREKLDAPQDVRRVWRGGAFYDDDWFVRCAFRYRDFPNDWGYYLGFRVAVLPLSF
jgi:formylglycine-generating enzyme required for sulfatase activity